MTSKRKTAGRFVILLLIVIYAIVILQNAWVGDDAYITFRTIDNWVNGYGLTWNVNERVQAYTHPLWVLLISLFYLFMGEAFYTVLVVSIVLSLGAAYLFAFKIVKTTMIAMDI